MCLVSDGARGWVIFARRLIDVRFQSSGWVPRLRERFMAFGTSYKMLGKARSSLVEEMPLLPTSFDLDEFHAASTSIMVTTKNRKRG